MLTWQGEKEFNKRFSNQQSSIGESGTALKYTEALLNPTILGKTASSFKNKTTFPSAEHRDIFSFDHRSYKDNYGCFSQGYIGY